MNLNFFDWIRQGVRQSVLLGISDATEKIGTQEQAQAVKTHLLGSLHEGRLIEGERLGKPRTKRKSLGRSLSQIIETEEK
jgi:hypothetical protein